MSRSADLVSGALLAGLGGFVTLQSFDYGWFRAGERVGPGLVPGLAGSVMLGLGVVIVLRALVRRTEMAARSPGAEPAGSDVADKAEPGPAERPRDPASTALVLGLTLAAIYATQWLGFVVTSGLLVFALVAVVEREAILRSAAYAAAVAFTVWLVFDYALNVPLPQSFLPGLGI